MLGFVEAVLMVSSISGRGCSVEGSQILVRMVLARSAAFSGSSRVVLVPSLWSIGWCLFFPSMECRQAQVFLVEEEKMVMTSAR